MTGFRSITSGPMKIRKSDVDYSENDLCETCKHQVKHHCERYDFAVHPTGHCENGYEARKD